MRASDRVEPVSPGSDQTQPHAAYSRRLLGFLGLGLGLVMGLNAWVDPFATLGHPGREGWSAEKTEAHMMGIRADTSVRLARERFEVVVFGSSRAKLAIDPQDPVFQGKRVFNAGLHATSLAELVPVVVYAMERRQPERVFVGLDLLMASAVRQPSREFEASAFVGTPPLAVLARRMASFDVLSASLATVRANREGRTGLYRGDGFVRRPSDADSASWGQEPQFEKSLRHFASNSETYGCFRYGTERVAGLSELLGALRRGGVEASLYFSPMHARHWELMEAMDLAPELERLKRDVAGLVAREAAESGEAPFDLWDFTGHDRFTTEPLAPEGEAMRWWWESSHAKPALGGRMVARMLGTGAEAGPGVRLELGDLEAHLSAQRAAREAWIAGHPEARRSARIIVAQTERVRRATCRGLEAAGTTPRSPAGPIF